MPSFSNQGTADLATPFSFQPVDGGAVDALPLGPPDLIGAKDGCHAYALCNGHCADTTLTQAQYDACASGCDSRASMAAMSRFGDVWTCGIDACSGVGRCKGRTDNSMGCYSCAYNALANVFGYTCPGDPLCNAPACVPLVSSCQLDLP
jgi:hypothetical protein